MVIIIIIVLMLIMIMIMMILMMIMIIIVLMLIMADSLLPDPPTDVQLSIFFAFIAAVRAFYDSHL